MSSSHADLLRADVSPGSTDRASSLPLARVVEASATLGARPEFADSRSETRETHLQSNDSPAVDATFEGNETVLESSPRVRAAAKTTGKPAKKRVLSPLACLDRALHAKTPSRRVVYARKGLASLCDVETQGLLLRQLYLGELESEQYDKARAVALQLVAISAMPDVAQHDAARACQALGDHDAALEHLRLAAELSPPDRKGFHLSTRASLLYVLDRPVEALKVLAEAFPHAGGAEPLLRAQQELARHAQGRGDSRDLTLAYHELLHHPSGEGYGRFVLGELAAARGDLRAAELHLGAFVAKVRRSRLAAKAALAPELRRAEKILSKSVWN